MASLSDDAVVAFAVDAGSVDGEAEVWAGVVDAVDDFEVDVVGVDCREGCFEDELEGNGGGGGGVGLTGSVETYLRLY